MKISRDGVWPMVKDRINRHVARFLLAGIVGLTLLVSLPTTVQAIVNPVHPLVLDGGVATSWNIGPIKPGDSGTKTVTLHNAGSVNGFVTIWISDIVNSEGVNPESETDTSPPGDLSKYLLFNVSCSGLQTNITLPNTINMLPAAGSSQYLKVTPLNAGDTVTLDWHWQLPPETGNDVQGDQLTFTINYMLEEFQTTPTTPTTSFYQGPYFLPDNTNIGANVTTGLFTHSVFIFSSDRLYELLIFEGTIGLDKDLKPLSEIRIDDMAVQPAPPTGANIIGLAYDFVPEGAFFDPPASFIFIYDPDKVPAGVNEEDLIPAFYDKLTGQWVELSDFIVDPVTHSINGKISHFTPYTILCDVVYTPALVPTPTPNLVLSGGFSVSNLTIEPPEVQTNQSTTITVYVSNTGSMEGDYTVTLMINGAKEGEKSVTVGAGQSQVVSFNVVKENAGSYSVSVNGLNGIFTVVAPSPEITELQTNWLLYILIIGAIIIIGLLIFFLCWRRRRARG